MPDQIEIIASTAGRATAEAIMEQIALGKLQLPTIWFTTEEAADYLKVSPRTLEDLRQVRNAGRGPQFVKVDHRTVRYKREWLDEWLLAKGAKTHNGE